MCVFQKYNADFDLSAKEGADSLAFVSLMEEKLMPALVRTLAVPLVRRGHVTRLLFLQIYAFWVEPKNYVDVTRRWYAEHMPFPLNFFLPGRMQRRQLEKLRLLRGDESLEAGDDLEKEVRPHRAQTPRCRQDAGPGRVGSMLRPPSSDSSRSCLPAVPRRRRVHEPSLPATGLTAVLLRRLVGLSVGLVKLQLFHT